MSHFSKVLAAQRQPQSHPSYLIAVFPSGNDAQKFGHTSVWCERDCYKEKDLVKAKCTEEIKIGGPLNHPSARCIRQVKRSDMVCVCSIIVPGEESHISMAKLVVLARWCRRPMPAGIKCGSFTVPPPLPPLASSRPIP